MVASSSCPSDEVVWLFLTDSQQVEPAQQHHLASCSSCRDRLKHAHEVDEVVLDVCSSAASPATPSLLAGRYELLEVLGRGGFGEVWLGRDTRLHRRVAVKLLRPDRLRPGALEALQAEARLLAELTDARLARRHIVGVHDCGEEAGQAYLVMEYLEGGSLAQRVRQFGPLTWRTATRYIADVGEALVGVHGRGLIHRDIKPDNILWDSQADEALLADFGITAHVAAAQGVISGTPGYLAPEVRQGDCTPAADVFALAASLYHLVTGRAPFFDAHKDTLQTSLERAGRGLAFPDPALARVPSALDETMRAGLEPDPRRRVSLEEFLARLRGAGAQSLAASLVSSTQYTPDPRLGLDLAVEVLAGPSPAALARVPTLAAVTTGYRDLEFVPEEPDCVRVEEGQYVQLRYTSRSGGYLTLLNVGTSGKVSVVFPNPQVKDTLLPAGGSRSVTLRVKPPAGTDEAVAILTRSQGGALPEQWRLQAEVGKYEGEPYRAYRDLEFVADQAEQSQPGEWTAVAVKIRHG